MAKRLFNHDTAVVRGNPAIPQTPCNRAKEIRSHRQIEGTHRVFADRLGQGIPTAIPLRINRDIADQRKELFKQFGFFIVFRCDHLTQPVAKLISRQIRARNTYHTAVLIELASNKPMEQSRPDFSPRQIPRRPEQYEIETVHRNYSRNHVLKRLCIAAIHVEIRGFSPGSNDSANMHFEKRITREFFVTPFQANDPP